MWKTKEIEWIDFEITSFCNIKCNGCLRETEPAVQSLLNSKYLPYELIVKRFTEEELPNLQIANFCGSVDEPCSHPELFKILDYFKGWKTPPHINIATNGSLKTINWWTRLGEHLKGYKHAVAFALDGLEDTHHIYREGSNYNKVLNNAKAFIQAGGNAIWQFIEFEHNEHQLEEAEQLSKDLGFFKFKIIRSTRDTYKSNTIKNTERTEKKESSRIECRYGNQKRIFVNHLGAMIPCCYVNAATLKYLATKKPAGDDYKMMLEDAGAELDISLEYNTVDEIIHGDLWTGIISSWNTDTPIKTCEKKCKKNFRDEFENRYN
jgi:MoaA/NifB/PqqE/SkfB family radical SAM enzyme